MRILPNGNIWLERGERIPYTCGNCGHMFQEPRYFCSAADPTAVHVCCPRCAYITDVADMPNFEIVPIKLKD